MHLVHLIFVLMSKYKQNNGWCTSKIGVKLPQLLADRKYYQLLIGDRWNSYRNYLFDACDEYINPKVGRSTWKARFLNPERIPQKRFDYIVEVMEKNLAFTLKEQLDFIIERINNKQSIINKNHEELNKLKHILEESHKAYEMYNNQYHEKE